MGDQPFQREWQQNAKAYDPADRVQLQRSDVIPDRAPCNEIAGPKQRSKRQCGSRGASLMLWGDFHLADFPVQTQMGPLIFATWEAR